MALTKISGSVVQQNNFSLSGVVTATSFTGDLTGNVTGNVTGTATTATNLADGANITTGTISNDRLPATITKNLTGDVTGNLTGNVTGTATTATNLADGANITTGTISNDRLPSTITKNLTGDVTGNLTGNVSSSGANTLGSLSVTNDATVGGALTVTGNLTVNGTTTTIDTVVTAIDSLAVDGDVTAGGNLNITGVSTFGGNIDLGDNDRLRLGDGQDLQIYHSGTDSIINDVGTGSLILAGSSQVSIRPAALNEFYATFNANSSVELYYDNSKKFETTGAGVTITGDARVTGILTVGQNSTTINGALEYPSIRPTLDLNFAATKTLDRRITFTRDSLGTYVDENGLVKYASNNVPRFDHDYETGESLGLLIEESRTNHEIWSNEFSNWSNNGNAMDMTDNAEIAPDGTRSACRFVQSSVTNASRSISSKTSLARNGQQSAQTIWVKRISGTDAQPTITLTSIGGGGGSTTIVPTNEWQKITKISTNANDGNSYYCQVLNIGWDINGAANDNVYAFWGSQFENNTNFATSYIPTSGSTVTRAADLAKITGTNFTDFYNQTEGTFFIDSGIARGSSYVGYLGTGTSSAADSGPSYNFNAILSDDDNSDIVFDIFNGNVGAQAFISILNSTTQRHRIAGAYASNDFSISLNGSSPSTDPSGTADPNQDQFWIGRRPYASAGWLNNSIKRVSYYNKRLPNAQLQGLTAQ
jgi:hypothetical protein